MTKMMIHEAFDRVSLSYFELVVATDLLSQPPAPEPDWNAFMAALMREDAYFQCLGLDLNRCGWLRPAYDSEKYFEEGDPVFGDGTIHILFKPRHDYLIAQAITSARARVAFAVRDYIQKRS